VLVIEKFDSWTDPYPFANSSLIWAQYEKSGMEGISMHGNCGGEELKNFLCMMFVYNLIISNT